MVCSMTKSRSQMLSEKAEAERTGALQTFL